MNTRSKLQGLTKDRMREMESKLFNMGHRCIIGVSLEESNVID